MSDEVKIAAEIKIRESGEAISSYTMRESNLTMVQIDAGQIESFCETLWNEKGEEQAIKPNGRDELSFGDFES